MTRCWVRCWVLWWNQLLPFSPAYFLPSVPIPIKVMPCQALLWIFLSWTYSWRPWREMLSWIQNVLCATQIFSLLKWYQYQTMHILSLIPFVRNRGRSILEHIDLQLARNPMVVNQQASYSAIIWTKHQQAITNSLKRISIQFVYLWFSSDIRWILRERVLHSFGVTSVFLFPLQYWCLSHVRVSANGYRLFKIFTWRRLQGTFLAKGKFVNDSRGDNSNGYGEDVDWRW